MKDIADAVQEIVRPHGGVQHERLRTGTVLYSVGPGGSTVRQEVGDEELLRHKGRCVDLACVGSLVLNDVTGLDHRPVGGTAFWSCRDPSDPTVSDWGYDSRHFDFGEFHGWIVQGDGAKRRIIDFALPEVETHIRQAGADPLFTRTYVDTTSRKLKGQGLMFYKADSRATANMKQVAVELGAEHRALADEVLHVLRLRRESPPEMVTRAA